MERPDTAARRRCGYGQGCSGFMRMRSLYLSFVLLFTTSGLSAQTNPLKLCVSQDAEGYDALRLARELSLRALKGGTTLAVVAITGKALTPEEEKRRTDAGASYVRVLLTERRAKVRSAQIERLGCDYDIKVWYHESADNFDANSPAGIPSPAPGAPDVPPSGDRTTVGYELRKAGSNKVIARASAPPRTVYVRQGRREFNPYPLFANQIVKKLDSARVLPTGQ